jgi:flagellar motor switch protein FliM
VSLFYEVSTCDLYVVTKVKNSSISLFDILSLSVGFKLRLL